MTLAIQAKLGTHSAPRWEVAKRASLRSVAIFAVTLLLSSMQCGCGERHGDVAAKRANSPAYTRNFLDAPRKS